MYEITFNSVYIWSRISYNLTFYARNTIFYIWLRLFLLILFHSTVYALAFSYVILPKNNRKWCYELKAFETLHNNCMYALSNSISERLKIFKKMWKRCRSIWLSDFIIARQHRTVSSSYPLKWYNLSKRYFYNTGNRCQYRTSRLRYICSFLT